MGYDMHIEGLPEDAAEKAAVLRKKATALYEKRNALPDPPQRGEGLEWKEGTGSEEWWRLHREAEEAGEESERLEGYFRLNIWGMQRCRATMHALGMLDVESNGAAFPEMETFGLSGDHPDDEEEWPEGSAEAKFLAACNAARDGFEEGGRMPVYKFGSNDGWLVTPHEIDNSLSMVEEFRQQREGKEGVLFVFVDHEIPPWFGEWLAFLDRAKSYKGFRVY